MKQQKNRSFVVQSVVRKCQASGVRLPAWLCRRWFSAASVHSQLSRSFIRSLLHRSGKLLWVLVNKMLQWAQVLFRRDSWTIVSIDKVRNFKKTSSSVALSSFSLLYLKNLLCNAISCQPVGGKCQITPIQFCHKVFCGSVIWSFKAGILFTSAWP